MIDTMWIKTIVELGGFGVVCLLMVWVLTRWLPERDRIHAEQLEAQRHEFIKALADSEELFRATLDEIQAKHAEQMRDLWARFDKLNDRWAETVKQMKGCG